MYRRRPVRQFLPPLLAGLCCIVYLFSDFELARFLDAWQGLGASYVLVAVLLTLVNVIALGLRLRYLTEERLELGDASKSALLGLSLNVLLPAKMGELGKIAYIADCAGTGVAESSRIVFWERFLDLHIIMALLLLAVGLGMPAQFSVGLWGLIACCWLALAIVRWRDDLVLNLLQRIGYEPLRCFLVDLAKQLGRGLSPSRLAGASLLSLAPWFVYAAQVAFVLMVSMAFELSLLQMLIVFLAACIAGSLPLTPGAIGIFEAAIVAVLTQYGVGKEIALSAAIMIHGMQFLPVLFGAAWALGVAAKLTNRDKETLNAA